MVFEASTTAVTQKYVSEMKRLSEDGRLTKADRDEAMRQTLLMIKKHLLDEGIDTQTEILSELLVDYVEEAVARLKVEK